MAKTVQTMERYLPKSLYSFGYTTLFNSMVKLAGTAGLQVETMNAKQCTVHLRNKRKVQNHIGGLHACSMALAAESASGIVIGMNIPDTHVPLIKEMNVKFVKRCSGDITATATLSDDDYTLINTSDKGQLTVTVAITDSANQTPIETQMIWAWIPKERKK